MSTTPFIIISSVFLFLLGVIWSKSSLLNAFLKVFMISLSLWGAFLTLQAFGFIVFVRG